MKNNGSATVFIIDDDQDTCDALRHLLESVNLQVKIFLSPLDFLQNFVPTYSGCIVTDIRMPEMSGLELLEQCRLRKITLPVFIISGYGDIQMAVRAIKAGAIDFIAKPFHEQRFIEEIQKAVARSAVSNENNLEDLKARFSQLTSREIDVIKLIVDGKLNKQIAHDLNIAISTVELHRSRIMLKMQSKTLAQLIKNYLTLTGVCGGTCDKHIDFHNEL